MCCKMQRLLWAVKSHVWDAISQSLGTDNENQIKTWMLKVIIITYVCKIHTKAYWVSILLSV